MTAVPPRERITQPQQTTLNKRARGQHAYLLTASDAGAQARAAVPAVPVSAQGQPNRNIDHQLHRPYTHTINTSTNEATLNSRLRVHLVELSCWGRIGSRELSMLSRRLNRDHRRTSRELDSGGHLLPL